MKIKLLSGQKIETLKLRENRKIIEKNIIDNPTNEWLSEFFEDTILFSESNFEIGEIEFDVSSENPSDTDFQNAKKIYEGLKNLPESIACDERFWISLTFGQFYSYMRYRFNPNNDKHNLTRRWFMPEESKKRDLFKQGISSLWWYSYITYDKQRDNPYELTEFCFKHKAFLYELYYRTFSSSKSVCHAVIQAMINYENVGGNVTLANSKEIMKYVSFLGGAYLIDSFTEQELCDKILMELIRIENEELEKPKRFTLT